MDTNLKIYSIKGYNKVRNVKLKNHTVHYSPEILDLLETYWAIVELIIFSLDLT